MTLIDFHYVSQCANKKRVNYHVTMDVCAADDSLTTCMHDNGYVSPRFTVSFNALFPHPSIKSKN